MLRYLYQLVFCSPDKKQNDDTHLPDTPQMNAQKSRILARIEEVSRIPYEEVFITSFDGLKLRGRYIRNRDGAPLLICFHGYRGTPVRDFCGGMAAYLDLGYNLLLAEQRAHCGSEGDTITFGVNERRDCLSWVSYAQERFGTKRIDIEAQEYARGFYEQVGFRQSSEPFILDGIPHCAEIYHSEEYRDDIPEYQAEKNVHLLRDAFHPDMEYKSSYEGESVSKDREIPVSIVLFDTATVERSNRAPSILLSSDVLEMPKTKKSKVKGTVSISNTGRSDLQIRSLQVFHPAINVNLPKTTIAPGETVNMQVTLVNKYRDLSNARYRLLMITNDYRRPVVLVSISQD